MSELADSVLLSRSGLTRLVDRLERQGLLRRESCPRTAAAAYAVITPRGRALFDRARATHLDGVRRRFLEPPLRGRAALRSARSGAGPAATTARPLGDRRRGHGVPRAAAHLADGACQAPHALVQLLGLEQREREPEGGLRAPLGVTAPPGVKVTPWRAASE